MELRGIAFNSSLRTENSDYYRVLTPALERLVSPAGLARKDLGKATVIPEGQLECPHPAESGCQGQEENGDFLNISGVPAGLSCTSRGPVRAPGDVC